MCTSQCEWEWRMRDELSASHPNMDNPGCVDRANHPLGGMDGSERTHRGQPFISQGNGTVSSGVNLDLNRDHTM